MKNVFFLFIIFFTAVSCKKEISTNLHQVSVQLEYPEGSALSAVEGVKVLFSGKGKVFEGLTDANGKVTIQVPTDVYDISTSETRKSGTNIYNYNGLNTNKPIVTDLNDGNAIQLKLQESRSSQLVIKEVFAGGTPHDNGTGVFAQDGYIIIYNNSEFDCVTNNLCIGTIAPSNTQASNVFYDPSGKLIYENENYIPTGSGIWYFKGELTIAPGEQIVVAMHSAVNNTEVHSKSINFANSSYYTMYDLASSYNNASYYPSPSNLIPTSNYLKAVKIGGANAWISSVTSPGIFIFEPKNGYTPESFMSDVSNVVLATYRKIPTDWILDGVESFLLGNNNNKKRFTSDVDAGSVYHINRKGYSIYRNVDEEATLNIASNVGKIVYGYDLGTTSIQGTTDPSNINAEASITNGARIIYKDTNNSTNDAHLRLKASLSNY